MTRNLDRDTPLRRIADTQHGLLNEERKPVLPGFWVYIGTYVSPGDPGNDPPVMSPSSPAYQDNVTYAAGIAKGEGHTSHQHGGAVDPHSQFRLQRYPEFGCL